MFASIINNAASTLSVKNALICAGSSLVFGVLIAASYYITGRGKGNKSFCLTLILLPVLVQTVIMLVNGNLGAGVAIVGAFSLIRFRSIPGNSRDISSIFLTMVVGLATGMGYVTYGAFITVFLCAVELVVYFLPFQTKSERQKSLKITICEDLDYTTIFDDIFEEYLKSVELEMVKTVNMGSMYQLQYLIEQKDESKEKEMIDALRCRNGNLTILCGRVMTPMEQL